MPRATRSAPGSELNEQERRLFSRMAEVYAGFSEYTDAQVGRIVDYLEESGQLDEHHHLLLRRQRRRRVRAARTAPPTRASSSTAIPTTIEDEPGRHGRCSGRRTPTTTTRPAGRTAFSTPYRRFKRYTYQGGVCDPLVVHWPRGIAARGEVRHQYHHSTDIVPTIYEACGVTMPDVVDGAEQTPLSGDVDGLLVRRRPTPRRRSGRSTTRCSATAASGTRAGRQ